MENCTVYSHYPSFGKIEQVLRDAFPKAAISLADDGSQQITVTVKAGLLSGKKTLTVNYRERVSPSYHLNEGADPLTANLRGMYNFVGSIPTSHTQARGMLQQKIATLNCEFACLAEPAFTDEFKTAVQRIAREQDAILFIQPGKTFARSSVQHFLNPEFQMILDVQGKSEVDTVSVKIDSRYFDSPASTTGEQQTRKERTEAFLKERGIAINVHLPVGPEVAAIQLQDTSAMLERAYALTLIAAKGEGAEQEGLDRARAALHIGGFSPYEETIYHTPVLNDQERANAVWRYESLNTILWALGLLESLPYPDTICNVSHIVGLMIKNSREVLAAKVAVRSTEEIVDALDMIYRMNWACVNARVKGEAVGGGIDPSVVFERHYALNWITREGGEDWDDIATNT
jgi:hypothetical protein